MQKIIQKFSLVLILIFCASLFFLLQLSPKVENTGILDELVGYWKGDNEENPGFEISKDYFITGNEKLVYKLSGNNITIYYSNFVFNGKFNIDGNKLYIESEGAVDLFHRWCDNLNTICPY